MARQLLTFEGGTDVPVLIKTESITEVPKSTSDLTAEELAEILIIKSTISQADIDAKKNSR